MDSSSKTILIADDEEDVRMLVEITLEDPAYRIVSAVDGEQALQQIRQIRPDLVILDWMMPGFNGLEVVTRLRQDPTTARIPVLLLTANDSREDEAEVQPFGIVAYLVKPFSPLKLLHLVREVLDE
jgi:two-component system phosphate regulon response regulator PhoB